MTVPAPPRWNHPVARWTPKLNRDATADVLRKVQAYKPFDGGAVLDDVGDALDDVTPAKDVVESLARRLQEHIKRLVIIAVANQAVDRDEVASRLVDRARALEASALSADYNEAVLQLRQMGWTANELLDRLVETKNLKEAV